MSCLERIPFFCLFLSDRKRLFKTLFLWSGTLSIGFSIAVVGATLLDLQQQVGTDLTSISYLLPARSVGYVVGSLFCESLDSSANYNVS